MNAHPRHTLLVSWLIAIGTVILIASTDGTRAILHAIGHLQPIWLIPAVAAELAAYAGYIAAYRSSAYAPDRRPLSLRLTLGLVVAGFGPFVARGGFSLDRQALAALHGDERAARVHVLGLGIVEYALLAPAAWLCALIMLLDGQRASLALTLPWVIGVPVGFLIAIWVSHPGRRGRWERGRGWLGELRCDVLRGLDVLRRIAAQPRAYCGAILGMGIYWAAEIACLGFSLRCFGVELSVPALVVAHATGYAASRRSLPLGGAGVTEAMLTLALVWVHVPAPSALAGVAAYRLVNFLAASLPALPAHASIRNMLHRHARDAPRRASARRGGQFLQ